jgi:hypothetical protein
MNENDEGTGGQEMFAVLLVSLSGRTINLGQVKDITDLAPGPGSSPKAEFNARVTFASGLSIDVPETRAEILDAAREQGVLGACND